MEALIKNIPQAAALSLAGQVSCLPGQIVSKTLAQDKRHSLTLFAFDRGEEISPLSSDGLPAEIPPRETTEPKLRDFRYTAARLSGEGCLLAQKGSPLRQGALLHIEKIFFAWEFTKGEGLSLLIINSSF